MVREPNWSEDEFEILLTSPNLSDEELGLRLPRRSPGAIGWVRAGIHAYHREKRNPGGILSKMMIRVLGEKRDTICCPKCGKAF